MHPKRKIFIFIAVLILATLACGPDPEPDSLATSAALTVAAHNAQNQPPSNDPANPQVTPAQPTNTSPQGQPPQAQPTNTIPPTATTKPTSSANCDAASLVSETVPDGSEFAMDEPFTKKWVIKNEGTCTWTSGYQWVFSSGENMGGPATKSMTAGTVAPGQSVEISLDLTAPNNPATYRGTYKIKNSGGQIFTANGFWVEIKVIQPQLGQPPVQPDPIHLAATTTLDRTWTFDLDTVTEGPASGFDFRYKIDVEQYIEPRNGALFFLWGAGEPTYDDCMFSPMNAGDILIWDPNDIGSYFCFDTDEGGLGYLKIDNFTPDAMVFSYIIWQNR